MGLTFMAVHAHPDDEATSSGGLFATLSDEGVRTVLVTCTNGECGDDLEGRKPHHEGHDPDAVALLREGELERSAEILGVDRLVRLGYRDSGMLGWEDNVHPSAFWNTPVDVAARRLYEILIEEQPQVVMTYNEQGFYGHPDHIQAHRITMAAVAMMSDPPTVYFNAVPATRMAMMRERWAEEDRRQREEDAKNGVESEPDHVPTFEGEPIEMGTPDDQIDAAIDVSAGAERKFDALCAHASQLASSGWLAMGRERFVEYMGVEWFVRATNPRNLAGPGSDIFAGYR